MHNRNKMLIKLLNLDIIKLNCYVSLYNARGDSCINV